MFLGQIENLKMRKNVQKRFFELTFLTHSETFKKN